MEAEKTSVLDLSPPIPPPTTLASPETAGLSSTSQQSPLHIIVRSRELSVILDAIRALATTQASLVEWMAGAEVTLAQNHAMLIQIQTHLGLPPISVTDPTQPTTRDHSVVSISAASLDMLPVAAVALDSPASTPPRE